MSFSFISSPTITSVIHFNALFIAPKCPKQHSCRCCYFGSSSSSKLRCPCISNSAKLKAFEDKPCSSLAAENLEEEDDDEEEGSFQVLTAVKSLYNDIVIVETQLSRVLLLDSTSNIHSIVNKGEKWTNSYWDEFASLPVIVPEGPIAIYGLGGGTAAHLMLDSWPSLQLEGWEIDEILIEKARAYLGLAELEKYTPSGGILHVHIGDVFSTTAGSGQYAGIVIDLFSEGKVLSQLQEVETWIELKSRLMHNGRIMVNCGGIDNKANIIDGQDYPRSSPPDDAWMKNSCIRALFQAFAGQLSWKTVPDHEGGNYLALTGSLPDMNSWSTKVPDHLRENVKLWRSCKPDL